MAAKEIEKIIDRFGEDRVLQHLRQLKSGQDNDNVLTIVTNESSHKIPTDKIKGELYVASKGLIQLDNIESLKIQYAEIIGRLSEKLREKEWAMIYLIAFGPSSLNMLIKLAVFRVTHTDTIDFVYNGNGNYLELDLNSRELIG